MEKRPFVAATREQRLLGQKLIIILEKACLELVEEKNRTYSLLNSQDHRDHLKANNREVQDARPDIVHQCLITLLDSPLNRSGKLVVFIRTSNNELIEVSPQLTVPRTWPQFQAMMGTDGIERSGCLLRTWENVMKKILPSFAPNAALRTLVAYCRLLHAAAAGLWVPPFAVTFLQRRSIKAEETNAVLLRVGLCFGA